MIGALPDPGFEPTLPLSLIHRLDQPVGFDLPSVLLDPAKSLSMAALMLTLFRDHWNYSGHPIDDRPEILATLYNLGYERSRPHGAPRANDFGRRVKAFMESEECRRLFPRHPQEASNDR